MARRGVLCALFLAFLGVALGALVGCDEDKGRFLPNNPPSVQLTSTPPDSGTAGYGVEFYWEGWDSDGEIDHFIYAIDPPDMYGTEDSVWTRTDAYSGSFVFQATDFDTLYHWRKPQVAKGWHVFVIKAVDDKGGVSEPDYVAFNATTIAPRTQIKTPPPSGGIQSYVGAAQEVGLRVTFRWEGDDPDGLMTEVPVGYLLKVVDVSGAFEHELAGKVRRDTTEWIERGAGERKTVLYFDNGRAYAVAFRAIDEAGAVEPLLLLNGNMLWVVGRESSSAPELVVRSPGLGYRSWKGWVMDTETYEVPLGSRYELEIFGNADLYGGLITGYSFGWDIKDLESDEIDPMGNGAWTPWSTGRTTIKADFTEERSYFLNVKCKDDGGGISLATLRFDVTPLEPTKNLCYIDDWRLHPKDAFYGEPLDDEVWQRMLDGYNYGEDWDDISWDEWDVPLSEEMPSLEFLSGFRVVVWSLNDNRSTSFNQQSGWYSMNKLNTRNVLASYMTGRVGGGERGKVWAFGRGLVESSLLAELGYICAYPYAVDHDLNYDPDCGIKAHTFASQFMHIVGEFEGSDPTSGGARINLDETYRSRPDYVYLDAVGPGMPADKYTRPPAAELYPDLPRKLTQVSSWTGRTFRAFEVLEYPGPDQEDQHLFFDPVSQEMTELIPLYRAHSRDADSFTNEKYCGFRYIPSEPADPGEIVYFFFPMFPVKDAQIRSIAKVVLSDWFGLPDPEAGAEADRGVPDRPADRSPPVEASGGPGVRER